MRALLFCLLAGSPSAGESAEVEEPNKPASAAQTAGSLGTGALTCQNWDACKRTCSIYGFAVRLGDKETRVEAPSLALFDRHGNAIEKAGMSTSAKLPKDATPGSMEFLNLYIHVPTGYRYEQLPMKGYVTFGGRAPREVLLVAPRPSLYVTAIFWGAGVLALVSVVIAACWIGRKALGNRMGSPAWKASESWSSNVTVGGAMVNGFLALGVMANPVMADKMSYAVLSLLFAVFIGLAPFVYNMFRRPVSTLPSAATDAQKRAEAFGLATAKQFEGYVVFFLLAGFLTLWGSMGQLLLFAVVMRELYLMDVLGREIELALGGLTAVLVTLLIIYGIYSLYQMATARSNPASGPAALAVPGREGSDEPATRLTPPEWGLL